MPIPLRRGHHLRPRRGGGVVDLWLRGWRPGLRRPQWCPEGAPRRHDDVQRREPADRPDRGGVIPLQPGHDVRYPRLGRIIQQGFGCGPGVPGQQPHPSRRLDDDLRRGGDRQCHRGIAGHGPAQ